MKFKSTPFLEGFRTSREIALNTNGNSDGDNINLMSYSKEKHLRARNLGNVGKIERLNLFSYSSA